MSRYAKTGSKDPNKHGQEFVFISSQNIVMFTIFLCTWTKLCQTLSYKNPPYTHWVSGQIDLGNVFLDAIANTHTLGLAQLKYWTFCFLPQQNLYKLTSWNPFS